MITDITKLFVDLAAIVTSQSQDNRVDPTKVPVYLAGTGWLQNGLQLCKSNIKPLYIRYETTADAVQLVTGEHRYYMAPVYNDGAQTTFELNINQVAVRDSSDLDISFTEFTAGENGLIYETESDTTISIDAGRHVFSRTTVVDDMMLFNACFNRLDAPSGEYHKPSISINTSYQNIGLQVISQFDDVVVYADTKDPYTAISVYSAGPEDDEPDEDLIADTVSTVAYENSFAHKNHMTLAYKGNFSLHLNDIFKDMVVSDKDTCYLDFKYSGTTDLHQNSNVPVTLHYYKTDVNANPDNVRAAFKNIHRYI